MVLHVNQTAILAFFSVLKSAAKTYEWIVEIANIRQSK